MNQHSRSELLLGKEAMKRLAMSKVAVFGIGGVGSYAAEALVRGGIGALELIDDDKICLTNINRQLFATRSTVGKDKCDAARERLTDVNPSCNVTIRKTFFMPENSDSFDFSSYDYVIDAVDTVTAKLEIIRLCGTANTPVISAMGAGNKLRPDMFEVADIYSTSVCPLARVMRYELRRMGIESLKVVYSKEKPAEELGADETLSCKNHCICPPDVKRKCADRRAIPGSVSFVPPVMGFLMSGEVIRDLSSVTRI